MIEEHYPDAVVLDPRPPEEKAKDHLHVAGAISLNWQELDISSLNFPSQRIQNGSYSCVFQAGATALEALTGEVISASEYFWRKNYPEQGSWLQDMADIFKNRLVVTEATSPSQNQSEPQMNQIKALATFLGISGYKQPNATNIDEIAEAIEAYKQCVMTFESNSGEWDMPNTTPVYLGTPIAFGHAICGLFYGLINGTKVIVCRDSAGIWSSPKGLRIITESFLLKRATGAIYFLGSKEKPVAPVVTDQVTETITTDQGSSIHTTETKGFWDRFKVFLTSLGISFTEKVGDLSSNENNMQTSNAGTYLALAGLIATVLSKYGIIIPQTDVASIISDLVIIYGVAHQFFDKQKVVEVAKAAGANIR